MVRSSGEMIAKKPGTDLIDGAPFVTGIFTLLKTVPLREY